MNDELFRQLKDAGFPFVSIGEPRIYQHRDIITIDGMDYFSPTLEELIEECGTKSGFILEWVERNKQWFATNYYDTLQGWGDTTSEATAKLWLALNKS